LWGWKRNDFQTATGHAAIYAGKDAGIRTAKGTQREKEGYNGANSDEVIQRNGSYMVKRVP